MLLFSLFIVVFFVLLRMIPESPRWLHVKGRHEETKYVINKIARINGNVIPDFDLPPVSGDTHGGSGAGMMDLFTHPVIRHRMVIQLLAW